MERHAHNAFFIIYMSMKYPKINVILNLVDDINIFIAADFLQFLKHFIDALKTFEKCLIKKRKVCFYNLMPHTFTVRNLGMTAA